MEDSRRQAAPPSSTAIGRADEQPLHLTNSRIQRTQSHTTRRLFAHLRQQQPALGRRIASRQGRPFFLEALKTQVHAQPLLVFAEQSPHGLKVVRGMRLNKVHTL